MWGRHRKRLLEGFWVLLNNADVLCVKTRGQQGKNMEVCPFKDTGAVVVFGQILLFLLSLCDAEEDMILY